MNMEENLNSLKKMLEEETLSHQTTLKNLQTVQCTLDKLKRICKLAVEEFEELQTKYMQGGELVERLTCIADSQEHANDITNVNDIRKQIEAELREAWEETLEHLNCCIIDADNRAFVAEQEVDVLRKKVQDLEKRMQHQHGVEPSAAPPSLQPPPPMTTTNFNPIGSLISLIGAGRKMPLKATPYSAKEQKMMNEMMDKMKKGMVHLRPIKKDLMASKSCPYSSATDEMKNVLNSLQYESGSKKEPTNELQLVFEQRNQRSVSSEQQRSWYQDHNSKMGRNEIALIFRKNLTKESSTGLCTRL